MFSGPGNIDELQCTLDFEAQRRLPSVLFPHCRWMSVIHGCPPSVIGPSLLLLSILGTVCPNVSRPHPLCLFCEVASRLSSSGVHSILPQHFRAKWQLSFSDTEFVPFFTYSLPYLLTFMLNSCTPTADVAGRQHLRSASQRKLIVPRYRVNSFGRRCFAVAGPSTWNSLPVSLRNIALSLNMFRRQLKTYFLRNIDEMYSAH